MTKRKNTEAASQTPSPAPRKRPGPAAPRPRPASGRPRGSKNVDRVEATVVMSRCPKCHSTNRTRYFNAPIVQDVRGGKEPLTGHPVTHTIFRATSCTDCGQARRDVSYEFDPAASKEEIASRYLPEQ